MPKIVNISPAQRARIIRLRTQEPPLTLHAIAARVGLSFTRVQRIVASIPELADISTGMQRLGGRPGHWQSKVKPAAPPSPLIPPDVALRRAAVAVNAARAACQADIDAAGKDEEITRAARKAMSAALKITMEMRRGIAANGTRDELVEARKLERQTRDIIERYRQPRRCRTCKAMINVWPCLLCSNWEHEAAYGKRKHRAKRLKELVHADATY